MLGYLRIALSNRNDRDDRENPVTKKLEYSRSRKERNRRKEERKEKKCKKNKRKEKSKDIFYAKKEGKLDKKKVTYTKA